MPNGQLYKKNELPKTIEYKGDNKPLAICVTYFDGRGGQIMKYLPTDDSTVFRMEESW